MGGMQANIASHVDQVHLVNLTTWTWNISEVDWLVFENEPFRNKTRAILPKLGTPI